jgi:CspA family cold shock protein
MATGVVRFFISAKGYGFILPDDTGQELFVHRSQLARGVFELKPRDKVSFEIGEANQGKGDGRQAMNVKVIG